MQRIIVLFILFIAFKSCLSSQNKGDYLMPPNIHGQEIVDSIKNTMPIYKAITYSSMRDDISRTFLVIQNAVDKKTDYWCIIDKKIIELGTLSNDSIFKYPNFNLAGVTVRYKNDKLTFTPPVGGCGVNTEIVIYQDSKMHFFFEYGDNITMHKDVVENIVYQKEWLEIIKKVLNCINVY